jgi:hypothetical protein
MFYMLYVEGRSAPNVVHTGREEAEQEAERLARLKDNLGRSVYILQPIKCCKVEVPPVKWEKL